MSINLMSAIFETEFFDLKDKDGNITKASTAKLVLLAMADHANDEGEGAYPSIDRLSRKTALSPQTIRNTFDALRYNGIIALTGMSKHGTNNHTINTKSFPKAIGKEVPFLTLQPLEGSNGYALPLQPVTSTPLTVRPESSLTVKEPSNGGLSEKDLEQVNAKVDAIIDAARTAKYQYREKFPPNLVPLVDCYVEATGQTPSKRVLFDWIGSFGEMYDEGITTEHLRAAYKHATRPDGGFLVSRPGSLINTAAAIKAQGGRKTDEKRGDYTRQLWEG